MTRAADLHKAAVLCRDREWFATAKWNVVAIYHKQFGGDVARKAYFDEELAKAVEEFRARKLLELDAALRELGVEASDG